MGERKYFQDVAKLGDVKEENDEELVVRAAVAREMVQDYGRYKALKPGNALDKAKRTVEVGAYLTNGHPSDHGVVTNQDEIIGQVRNPEFDDEENVLYADLAFDKKRTAPKVIEEIKEGERTDVSIGFYADELMDEGRYQGDEYDRRQTNIVIDHVASLAPDSMGRCSSEDGCGIIENMDGVETAESLVLEEQDNEEMRLGNFAVHDEEALNQAVDGLRERGLSATVRECNCGDHHAHIEVEQVDFEELEDEDSRNAVEILDRDSEDPKFQWGDIYDEFGPSGMPSEEKQDKFIRGQTEDNNVDNMGDDNQPDISEDELEELRNKADRADELEEKRAEELRDRLVEKYGVDEDKVEDMNVDELQRFEDTLDASDLVQDNGEEDDDGTDDDGEVVDTRTGPDGEQDDDILNHDKTNEKGLIAADTNSYNGKA